MNQLQVRRWTSVFVTSLCMTSCAVWGRSARAAGADVWTKSVGNTNAPIYDGFGATSDVAANKGVACLRVFNGQIYASVGQEESGSGNPLSIWRSSDLTNWTQVGAGTFIVNDIDCFSIETDGNSHMFIGTHVTGAGANIYSSTNGSTWSLFDGAGNGLARNSAAWASHMTVVNTNLFAGVIYNNGTNQVWRRPVDGSVLWSKVIDFHSGLGLADGARTNFAATYFHAVGSTIFMLAYGGTNTFLYQSTDLRGTNWVINTQAGSGFGDSNNVNLASMVDFKDYLYVTTHNTNAGGQLWRTPLSNALANGAQPWTEVVSDGFGQGARIAELHHISAGLGELWISTLGDQTSQTAQVWRSVDGTNWIQSNVDGFTNGGKAGGRSPVVEVFGDSVVWGGGTLTPVTGAQVWFTTPQPPVLLVSSAYGVPMPTVGSNVVVMGTNLQCSVISSVTAGGTQYVNTGWVGTGSIPASGTSNTVSCTITNDSSLTWQWGTNYWLDLVVTNGGTISTNDGWYASGANVAFDASSQVGFTFAGWFGDTNECALNGQQITAPMTTARSIEARFSVMTQSLVISSDYDSPVPAVGTNWLAWGTTRACSVTASVTWGGTQYVNSGWTGAGDVPASGGSNAVSFLVATNSALTWQWGTNYWLDVVVTNGGTINTNDSWQSAGTNVSFSATNLVGYAFTGWFGVTNGCVINGTQISATMTQARMLEARFAGIPAMSLQATGFSFAGQVYSSISGQSLVVSNSGNGTLNYTIASDMFWLSVSNGSGSLMAGQATSHVVNVATRGLDPLRVYWGHLTVSEQASTNSPRVLPVSVTLNPYPPPSTMIGWGDNGSGQSSSPADLTNAVLLAGGSAHSVALRWDGTVKAWGVNNANQCNVPASATNGIGLSVGENHSLVLRRDGTMVAWGDNSQGQINVPGGMTNVVSVGAGAWHSLAVKADGTVAGWGMNDKGQASVPGGITNAIAVCAGHYHTVILKSDGTLQGWGDNSESQLNFPVGLTNVVAIRAGHHHTMALKADGTVVAWGSNVEGQLNVPPGLSNVVAISSGHFHCLALKSDGTVVAWGYNASGQANVPSTLAHVAVVGGGWYHSLAAVPMSSMSVSSAYGNPASTNGTYSITRGTIQTNSVTNIITAGGTQYVNLGWAGTGSAPASGTSNSVSFTITNDSTITWLWGTNYWLSAAAMTNGSVDVSNAWYRAGSNATVTAIPVQYWHFDSWTGDVPAGEVSSNPVTLTMSMARTILARFAENVTASNAVPELWLASFGVTSNFDAAAEADADGDGVPAWEEYYADTDPTSTNSVFRVVAGTNGATVSAVSFASSTGRVYFLDLTTNLTLGGWAGIAGQTNVQGNGATLTLSDTNPPPVRRFYRVRVALP